MPADKIEPCIYDLYKNMKKTGIFETDDEAIEKLRPNFDEGQVLIKWSNGKISIIEYTKSKE